METSKELKNYIENNDVKHLQCFVVNQHNLFMQLWINENISKLRNELELSIQELGRLRRVSTSNTEILYQLGIWRGILDSFKTLYENKIREDEILRVLHIEDPILMKALDYIYNQTSSVRHSELVKVLDVDSVILVNSLVPAISSYVINAVGTGKRTRYFMNTITRRIYKKENVK